MLIEVRIGPGKSKLNASILKVQQLFGISSSKTHRVPHITLYGEFIADRKQVWRVMEVMVSIGRDYSLLPYVIDGFRWVEGEKGKVIYFNIVPSEEFKEFRRKLAEKLLEVVPETKPYDRKGDFLFHSTLVYKLSNEEFERVWPYVCGKKLLLQKPQPRDTEFEDYTMRHFYLPMNALRATFLNNQAKIICEYDFLQKRLLTRMEALNMRQWQETLRLFRIKKRIESCKPDCNQKPPYLIGDLHLDHANIIHYCARPFSSSNVEEMNNVLVNNWNSTVGDNMIYFLGDLSFGRGARSADYWLRKLKGRIHFIRGNHEAGVRNSREYEVLEYEGYKFLLVHDPDNLPIDWSQWVIHGHKHNNDMKNYPFINGDRKTINVSAELVNYRPVGLDFLVSLNLGSIKRMDMIDSIPERIS